MKKLFLILASLFLFSNAFAQFDDQSETRSLDDIINDQSKVTLVNVNDSHYRKVWSRCTFFNINYLNTNLSAENVPLNATGDKTSADYNQKFGAGITWGCSYRFHRKPIGRILFFGLDYVWTDFNFNKYEETTQPDGFDLGTISTYNLPWHNKKTTIDYGMSLGPSITLYPFTHLNKRALDHIRLQAYYRVGYNVKLAMIGDLEKEIPKNNLGSFDGTAWGHGLYTEWGANFSWNFMGVGFAKRTDKGFGMKSTTNTFEKTPVTFDQNTTRLYVQFRF